jgi:hypothetical protein
MHHRRSNCLKAWDELGIGNSQKLQVIDSAQKAKLRRGQNRAFEASQFSQTEPSPATCSFQTSCYTSLRESRVSFSKSLTNDSPVPSLSMGGQTPRDLVSKTRTPEDEYGALQIYATDCGKLTQTLSVQYRDLLL